MRFGNPIRGQFRGTHLYGSVFFLFIVLLAISPRIPLGIDVGRRADLRLHEFLIVPMVAVAVYLHMTHRIPLRSPWSPLIAFSFFSAGAALLFTFITSPTEQLRIASFSYRFIVFFAIVFAVSVFVFILRSESTKYLVVGIAFGFFANAGSVIANGILGNNALIENPYGADYLVYGPGLIGEANPLTSSLFFVFIGAVAGGLWRVRFINTSVLTVVLGVSFFSVSLISNRSGLLAFLAVSGAIFSLRSPYLHRKIAFAGVALVPLAFVMMNHPRFPLDRLQGEGLIRLRIWADSLDRTITNPLLGYGIGNAEPHQAYIRLVGDLGLIAGGCFLFFLFAVLLRKINPLGNQQEPAKTQPPTNLRQSTIAWWTILKLFTFGLLVAGIVTDSLTPVLPWHLLAMLVGVVAGLTNSHSDHPKAFTRRLSETDTRVASDSRTYVGRVF